MRIPHTADLEDLSTALASLAVRLRNLALCIIAGVAATCLSSGASRAQDCNPLRFHHPGFITVPEVRAIQQHIARGEEPWKAAYDAMRNSPYAALDYVAHPVVVVSSGINNSHPVGTFDETKDTYAAYTQTLLWIFTGDERYARNAAAILDAWSGTLKSHQGGNWYLQASWAGSTFPLSAELLRATYPKWSKEEIAQFKTMLNTAFLPILHNRPAYGNREMSTINAMMAIGVFADDGAAFCEGLSHWRSYVPNYIYMSSDGPEPARPTFLQMTPSDEMLMAMNANLFPNGGNWISLAKSVTRIGDDRTAFAKWTVERWWYNPGGPLVDGLCQETGRDLEHSELAMAGIFNAADIAWRQGIDLFTPNAARLAAFLERSSSFRLGAPAPPGLYGGQIDRNNDIVQAYEVGLNRLKRENGIKLPLTQKLLAAVIRPVAVAHKAMPAPAGVEAHGILGPASLLSVWQTLTENDD